MIHFKKDEGPTIKGGGVDVLLKKLYELDATLTRNLKNNKDNGELRYFQGASAVTDSLIKILK